MIEVSALFATRRELVIYLVFMVCVGPKARKLLNNPACLYPTDQERPAAITEILPLLRRPTHRFVRCKQHWANSYAEVTLPHLQPKSNTIPNLLFAYSHAPLSSRKNACLQTNQNPVISTGAKRSGETCSCSCSCCCCCCCCCCCSCSCSCCCCCLCCHRIYQHHHRRLSF